MLDLGSGVVGGARGWVASRAGLWGVPATWVWVVGISPQILEHPTSICNTGVNDSNDLRQHLNITVFDTMTNSGPGCQLQILVECNYCIAKDKNLYNFFFQTSKYLSFIFFLFVM